MADLSINPPTTSIAEGSKSSGRSFFGFFKKKILPALVLPSFKNSFNGFKTLAFDAEKRRALVGEKLEERKVINKLRPIKAKALSGNKQAAFSAARIIKGHEDDYTTESLHYYSQAASARGSRNDKEAPPFAIQSRFALATYHVKRLEKALRDQDSKAGKKHAELAIRYYKKVLNGTSKDTNSKHSNATNQINAIKEKLDQSGLPISLAPNTLNAEEKSQAQLDFEDAAIAHDPLGENKRAVALFKKSATQGHVAARFNLAVSLANGVGIEQNKGLATQITTSLIKSVSAKLMRAKDIPMKIRDLKMLQGATDLLQKLNTNADTSQIELLKASHPGDDAEKTLKPSKTSESLRSLAAKFMARSKANIMNLEEFSLVQAASKELVPEPMPAQEPALA